jgi:hypothetical protein
VYLNFDMTKNFFFFFSIYKENSSGTVSVLNLSELVDKANPTGSTNSGVLNYFHALCHQPVPGPLVGGSAASKDVNKWLDEMIAWYESSASDFQRGDTRKLLISLLKILCQYYGKLRSPLGSDPQEVLYLFFALLLLQLSSMCAFFIFLACFPLLPLSIEITYLRRIKYCVMIIA